MQLEQTVAANQALGSDDDESDSDEEDDDDDEDDNDNNDNNDVNKVTPVAAKTTAATIDEIAATRPLPVIPAKKRESRSKTRSTATASTSDIGSRSRGNSSGLLALDSALAMLDEAYNETDVLLQKSSSPSTPSTEKKEVILAIRLADSSFQTLLRFSLQSTVDEALAQVRQSLIRVGQIDEKDSKSYALFRVQGPNERRLEPPSGTLAKFDLVNRDVLIYQVSSALKKAASDDHAVLLIGADAGRPLLMSEIDQRVSGLPRKLNRPRRRLHCQASYFRAADKRRYSLLLLFNDVLVLCRPKSSVSRLVDRVRAAVDTRASREDTSGAAASPVLSPLIKTSRHGASYHAGAAVPAASDDGFEYVMSFELQFLHIREQASCTEGLTHAFAVFGTSRFDHPPTTAARASSPRLGVDDDSLLDQLPVVALQFSTSAERIDFLGELRQVIRSNRTSFDVDGDFGEPNEASTSSRRSVFTSLKRQPHPATTTAAAPAAAAPKPLTKSPTRSPPSSPRNDAAAVGASSSSPPHSPRADVSAEQGGTGSLRKRAMAQSPRPMFANKPEPSEADVRSHVKQLLVTVKSVRTAAAASEQSADARSLLKVQLSEYDDMCARLDVSVATPYRALYTALHEFARCVDEQESEAVAAQRFHEIVEKARVLMNTPMTK
jgi:hypothetical protein